MGSPVYSCEYKRLEDDRKISIIRRHGVSVGLGPTIVHSGLQVFARALTAAPERAPVTFPPLSGHSATANHPPQPVKPANGHRVMREA